MAATWPSIMPLGATTPAPAAAWATAIEPYRSSVASLSTWPASVSMPQWPWSVYSSMQRSAISTVSSPTSLTRSPSASWTMPAGSSAPEPRASLTAGMPNRTSPPTPAPTASTAALRRLSLVCCMTPGIDGTGCGSSIPSLTNSGSTRSAGRRLVCATKRRRAAVRRSLRGRTAGNPAAIGFLLTWAHTDPTLGAAARFTLRCCVYLTRDPYRIRRRAPRRRSLGLRTGSPASIAASRIAAPWSASASTRAVTDGRGAITSTLSPNSAAVFAVSGPITAIAVTACGLPAIPIRFRNVDGEKKSTASKPTPLLASRCGAVGGDPLARPAEAGEPGQEGLGRDVRTRQQHPVDRVEHVVVGGPDVGQALGGLLLVRHQVGHDAELAQ